MKINLRKLKLQQEDTVYFSYTGNLDDNFLRSADASLSEPVGIELVIKKHETVYLGQGLLKGSIKFRCSRCLKSFAQALELELLFVIAETGNESEYDEEVLLMHNDEVDIAPYIEGVIFSQVPLNPVCDLNCKGLCPVCGRNKNIEECNCHIEDIDPRWEKLKKLK